MTQEKLGPDNKYFKNIQVLRFLSVLFVVLYHLNVPYFENGYMGVDIFFIISGYVVTKSIYSQLQKGTFKILLFYNQRLKRLLPALYSMLMVTFIFSLIYDPPHATKDISQAIVSIVVYLSNIFYYTEIDYFNNFHNESALLHTWSLSLEEQFYFILPLTIYLLYKTPKLFKFLVTFFILLSASSYYFTLSSQPLASFYFPYNRFWELFLGVFIALVNRRYSNTIISNISFGLLVLFIIIPTNEYKLILVIILSIIIILFSETKISIFYNKIFLIGGALSYSLYLWHQPIIYFFNKAFQFKSGYLFTIGIIFITTITAYFSYYYIENRFRYSNNKFVIHKLILFSVILLIIGYSGHKTLGFFDLKTRIWNTGNHVFDRNKVFKDRDALWNTLLNRNERDSSVVIIGDSKAEDFYVSCAMNPGGNKYFTLFKTQTSYYSKADTLNSSGLTKIFSSDSVKKVVFTHTWKARDNQNIAFLIKYFSKKYNKQIFVLSTCNFNDVASLNFDFSRKKMTEKERRVNYYLNLRKDWQRQSDELKSQLYNEKNITWIDKENAFCANKECNLELYEGRPLIYDSGHLTIDGAIFFGKWVSNFLY
jgi:peptidoglycan/LPS O-acetylase OafA/YrhL